MFRNVLGSEMDILIHHILTIVRSIIIFALVVYIGIAVLLFVLQSRLVYLPLRTITATPASLRLAYEDVTFEAGDGVKLSGWFVTAEQSRGVVLFCHGNAGNISHRLESIEIFHRLGLSVFIFDYRGYGESEGKPGENGTYLDAEASWRWLVENQGISPDSIIIFGRSLGGAIAAWLAKEHPPKALILESAFTSIRDMGADLYPWIPIRFISRFHYTTVVYLKEITSPVLVIHSPQDDIIPYSHGQRLFETANEPKEFFKISGSHNEGFLLTGKRYEKGLDSFISRYARE